MRDYTKTRFTFDGEMRDVYRRGNGPGVLIMHEVPGITPEVRRFADYVANAGFSVALPDMFGTQGREFSNAYAAQGLLRACVSREFHVLATNRSSPITNWLRALARSLHDELGGPGIGAIGMCLTGNFALALMLDDCLMAPVLSQPSLPFPLGAERRGALHISAADLERVKQRVAGEVPLLALRFTADPLCPPERFETLRRELGAGFEAIEIDSSPGNPHGLPRSAHSVVTKDLVDETGHPTRQALDRVIAFFRERLPRA